MGMDDQHEQPVRRRADQGSNGKGALGVWRARGVDVETVGDALWQPAMPKPDRLLGLGVGRWVGVAAMRAEKHALDGLRDGLAMRRIAVVQRGEGAVQKLVRQAPRQGVEYRFR